MHLIMQALNTATLQFNAIKISNEVLNLVSPPEAYLRCTTQKIESEDIYIMQIIRLQRA
ncbi:hypothetical protein C0J52_25535 [Blattella germanica]|nr:hypothetical protein C0J52_25535 [Blattella germanica]